MSRPPLEVAELIRTAGTAFLERNRRWLSWKHVKVLLAIARCRTAALGGHLDECTRCGHRAISYNSCRNRHCPKCQTAARDRWIAARQRELLPTRYVHVVFTLPHQLALLVLRNKKVVYDLLFRASAETLLEVARDPRHLGAEIGFFSVLHTWSQKLQLHPHVHCVIPAGGLSLDHTHWIKSRDRFFLSVHVLRRVFRGKFVAGLQRAFRDGRLHFSGDLTLLAQPKLFAAWLRPLFRKDWVVYSKPPFGGPEYVLQYLGRYTHRVAISNHRLISLADGKVTFRCWAQHQNRTPNKTPPPPKTPATFGAAQSVADRWRSSKDLRLRKSNFVLHRSPSPHETTINITKGSGALSRSLLLRLLAQIISSSPSSRLSPPSRRASPTVIPLSTPSFLPCRTPSTHLYTGLFHHSIPIGPAPAATTGGFVQTAVSKARKRTALPPSSSLEPRFRYSTSVIRHVRSL